MAGDVKRYELLAPGIAYCDEFEREDGEWVRYADHAARLTALEQENKRLREALEPFGEVDGHFDGYVRDDDTVSVALRNIKARHVRAARAALTHEDKP